MHFPLPCPVIFAIQLCLLSLTASSTVSPILSNETNKAVGEMVKLIEEGYSCRVVPLNSTKIRSKKLIVDCKDTYCFACQKQTVEVKNETEEKYVPLFSPVPRSTVLEVRELMGKSHTCGVTAVKAAKIKISGVKAWCETNFCMICENRDILSSKFSETNVLRLDRSLVDRLMKEIEKGRRCSITSKRIKKGKMRGTCEAGVCFQCGKESLKDLLPKNLQKGILTVEKKFIVDIRNLMTKENFSCGKTRQQSTEIDSPNLKIRCSGRLCFLCKKELTAEVDVETADVTPEVLSAVLATLEKGSACAATLVNREMFPEEGLVFHCEPGICFICQQT